MNNRPKSLTTEGPAISPLSVVRMLWKRKLILVGLTAVCSIVAAVVVWRLPAIYKAEALVLVDSQKIPEKFVSSTVSSGVTDRLAAISQEIMSTTRLLKIIHDFDLYREMRKHKPEEEVVEQMRRDISVTVQKDNWATGKPVAFKVGYQGENANVVSEVANQLANLYIDENLQTREVEASGTSEFIDNQLAQAKRELEEQEQKVARFKQEHNGSLPEQENPLLSNLSSLRLQLQGIQDSLNRGQQTKLMLETSLANEQSSEANLERALQLQAAGSGVSMTDIAPTSQGDKKLQEMEQQLEDLRAKYTPEHPDVLAMEAEVARLKAKEQVETKPIAAPATSSKDAAATPSHMAAAPVINQTLLQEKAKLALMQSQISALKQDMAFQEAEKQRVLQQMSASQGRIDQLPLVEQQMAGLTRDYDISKENYKSLLDKRIAAEMSTDMERRQKSERFEIIDPARVPEKPFKPNRQLFLIVGVVASLALALATAFGLEFRKGVLLGEWELAQDVVVLGRVPRITMTAEKVRRSSTKLLKTVTAGSLAGSLMIAAIAFYVLRMRS